MRKPRPGEPGVHHVFPTVALIAKMYDMTGKTDLGALGVAQQHEGGLGGGAVAGEPARSEAQILAVLNHEGPVDDDLANARAGVGAQPPLVGAHAVSAAVLQRLDRPRALAIVGAGRGAVHLDLDGFVVTVTGPGVPWMANGVAVAALGDRPRIAWSAATPPAWDPVVPPLAGGRAAVAALSAWLSARVTVPDLAIEVAAERLVGRGPGLTPEGDDILAGAAVGMRALAAAAGLPPDRAGRLVRALCPADLRLRTGTLSATLLELALEGMAPEPVQRLLGTGDRDAALSDLRRLGAFDRRCHRGRDRAGGRVSDGRHSASVVSGRTRGRPPEAVAERPRCR